MKTIIKEVTYGTFDLGGSYSEVNDVVSEMNRELLNSICENEEDYKLVQELYNNQAFEIKLAVTEELFNDFMTNNLVDDAIMVVLHNVRLQQKLVFIIA